MSTAIGTSNVWYGDDEPDEHGCLWLKTDGTFYIQTGATGEGTKVQILTLGNASELLSTFSFAPRAVASSTSTSSASVSSDSADLILATQSYGLR
jgi:hypothetical protein